MVSRHSLFFEFGIGSRDNRRQGVPLTQEVLSIELLKTCVWLSYKKSQFVETQEKHIPAHEQLRSFDFLNKFFHIECIERNISKIRLYFSVRQYHLR